MTLGDDKIVKKDSMKYFVGLIDHHDSFTANLARYFRLLGAEVDLLQSSSLSPSSSINSRWTHLCLGPGPGSPSTVPSTMGLLEQTIDCLPILGVCLGHQCLGVALGCPTIRSPHPHHGRASRIHPKDDPLFANIPSPFLVGRYHSLILDSDHIPSDLLVTALAEDDGAVMAFRHRHKPIHGIQFHPESILSDYGMQILKNFLDLKIGLS